MRCEDQILSGIDETWYFSVFLRGFHILFYFWEKTKKKILSLTSNHRSLMNSVRDESLQPNLLDSLQSLVQANKHCPAKKSKGIKFYSSKTQNSHLQMIQ